MEVEYKKCFFFKGIDSQSIESKKTSTKKAGNSDSDECKSDI